MYLSISNLIQTFFDKFHNVLILAGFALAGFVVSLILFQILKLALIRFSGPHKKAINEHFKFSVRIVITIIFLNIGLSMTNFSDSTDLIIHRVFYVFMVFSLAYILIKVLNYAKDLLYYKFDVTVVGNLSQRKARTQVDFLQNVGSVFIVGIAVAIVLMSFERVRELGTSILASAGIAGVIIGFAAQKSLSNLLAGLQIAFTQPIRYDDVVIVEGEYGRIEEITLTYVVVNCWDLRRLIVPISYFIDKPFQNWTRTSADLLGTVYFYVDYSLPVDDIRTELARILANEGKVLWDGKVSAVQITNADAKSMELRILVSGNNSGSLFDLRSMIREKVIAFILKNYPESLPTTRILSRSEAVHGNSIASDHHHRSSPDTTLQ